MGLDFEMGMCVWMKWQTLVPAGRGPFALHHRVDVVEFQMCLPILIRCLDFEMDMCQWMKWRALVPVGRGLLELYHWVDVMEFQMSRELRVWRLLKPAGLTVSRYAMMRAFFVLPNWLEF